MTRVISFVINLTRDTEAQDLLEYALLMALIAVAAVLTVTQLGRTVTDILWAPIVTSNI